MINSKYHATSLLDIVLQNYKYLLVGVTLVRTSSSLCWLSPQIDLRLRVPGQQSLHLLLGKGRGSARTRLLHAWYRGLRCAQGVDHVLD